MMSIMYYFFLNVADHYDLFSNVFPPQIITYQVSPTSSVTQKTLPRNCFTVKKIEEYVPRPFQRFVFAYIIQKLAFNELENHAQCDTVKGDTAKTCNRLIPIYDRWEQSTSWPKPQDIVSLEFAHLLCQDVQKGKKNQRKRSLSDSQVESDISFETNSVESDQIEPLNSQVIKKRGLDNVSNMSSMDLDANRNFLEAIMI